MFPTAHKFWGILDYFTSIPLQTFNRGLQDAYLSVSVQPSTGLAFTLTLHDFRLAEEYVGRTALGREMDLVGKFEYNRFLTFEGGGGVFLPEEIMEFTFGGQDPGMWAYLSVHARFW
jgi:hypothetical protein